MSQDELRRLLGGYATGTLTEAERQALFAAALDDQELFDELGREQALKELLEVPGARTRLAAALAPPRTAWWRTPLPWALAGTLAVALLVMIVMRRTPPPTEIAAVKVAPPVEDRAAQPAQGETAKEQQPKTLRVEPPTPPADLRKQTFQEPETSRRDADSNRAAPPPPVLPPQEALKKEESVKTDSLGPALTGKSVADEKDTHPPVQAATQAAQSQVPSGVGREQQLAAANSAAPSPTAALRSAAPAAAGGFLARPRFAFDYTIRRDSLTVRLLAAGFLQVTAQTSSGQQVVLQPASRLESGTSVSIAVPSGFATLTVEFSAKAAARDLVNSLASRDAVGVQKAAKARAKASVSKEKTGHVEEPLPAADPSVSIVLAVPTE